MKESTDTARKIADELAACGVKLVASLPDNWLIRLIEVVDRDERFSHVPVNREESAIGLCSGAYMGAMGSAALMGASGFMTVIYAITKINYTYEVPLLLLLTLRGAAGDHQPCANNLASGSSAVHSRSPEGMRMKSISMPFACLPRIAATNS